MFRYTLIAFTLLVFTACDTGETSTENAAPVQEADSSAMTAAAGTKALPKTRQDTLMLEGMPEPVALNLYEAPEGWPITFHTYVPANFKVETLTNQRDHTIRFSMGDAVINFVIMPEGTNRSRAQSMAKASLGATNVQSCRPSYKWQWECLYVSEKPDQIASVLLGEQQGRQFYYHISYPAEYADGFSPRYAKVLEEWRFE